MKKLIENISKGTFPALIAISALSVSASAAFYSVSGLSKLFAGAAFAVTVMAASLEISKLVIASLLYQYWSTINKLLRAYLTIAAFILVIITSMGIYGFLSAAYQDTYNQLKIKNNQTAFLTQKKDFYANDVARFDDELKRISNNISTLSNAKATSIQVRDTSSSTGFRQTISTAELRLSQKRIEVEEENRAAVQAKREIAADSLQKYQIQILDLENNTEVAGELGPLEYLSGLTGVSMDKIINILLLVIIFVFDPLAISLVIAANFAFDNAFPKREEETLISDVFEDEEFDEDDFVEEDVNEEEEISEEERLRLYQVYGESGSIDEPEIESEDPIEFEDAEKDVISEEEDLNTQIENLKRYLDKERIGGINPRLETDIKNEIIALEKLRDNEEDLTINY